MRKESTALQGAFNVVEIVFVELSTALTIVETKEEKRERVRRIAGELRTAIRLLDDYLMETMP